MTSNIGSIENSTHYVFTEDGDIEIEQIVNSTGVVITSNNGSINVKNKIDSNSNVTLDAATTITIGEKIDNGSKASLFTKGNITISQKVDNRSSASLTSELGTITIGRKIDNGSGAFISAGTGVTIGQKVDNRSGATIYCGGLIDIPQGVDNDSTVAFRAPEIVCPVNDHAQLLEIPVDFTAEVQRRLDGLMHGLTPHRAPQA